RAIDVFRRELGAAPRGHSVVYGGDYWNVICFPSAEALDVFAGAFGEGAPFDPRDRGRGHNWMRWTPREKPITFGERAEIEAMRMCNLYSHTSNREAIIRI